MKQIINKILYPNKIAGFIFFNLGFGLLIYVFSWHLEDTILAYISYILSTYALIIFVLWFYKICQFSNDFIKNTRLYKKYQQNYLDITKVTMYISTILNILYCLFNLIIGFYYQSFWFITFAIYYFLLILMKGLLLYNVKDLGENRPKEYKKLKNCGLLLLLLNFILIGIVILILKTNQNISYAGYVIYIVALYNFYLIISAFINVFKYRKSLSPIITASKCINLTVAMISMLSLEVAMITEFGNDIDFKMVMTGIMGLFICLINSVMALYMVIKANKNLKHHN